MSSGQKIRWGILATGAIAKAFTQDLKLLPDAEVTAVGSRSLESARRFADTHGIARAHGSWADLAADPDVDVIYVATPHSAHFEAAALCLDAGKAVLCEKPLTLNLSQAEELIALARKRNTFLMEGMWTRVHPVVRRVLSLIDEGAIGDVNYVQADFGSVAPLDITHRKRDPWLGGGALLDIGVYPVAFAHLLLGKPSSVQAYARLTPEGVDENTGILLGHESGAVAVLACSLTAAMPIVAAISGTKGRIELPHGFYRPSGYVLSRLGHEPEEVRMPDGPGNGFRHEATEVMRCLRAGEKESPLVPHEDTLAVMATLDTIRERIGLRYPQE